MAAGLLLNPLTTAREAPGVALWCFKKSGAVSRQSFSRGAPGYARYPSVQVSAAAG